jgi:hypothetical protein
VNLPPNKARWPSWALEEWAERSAIMEFQAHMTRETAEFRAEENVRRNALSRDREGKERTTKCDQIA